MPGTRKSGRKPIPTRLKILRGNPGHQKLPENEPEPELGMPPCPIHLSEKQREMWDYYAPMLLNEGVITVMDGALLASLCITSAKIVELNGTQTDDRQSRLLLQWIQQEQRMLSEFGIGPSSRTKVTKAKGSESLGVETRKRG